MNNLDPIGTKTFKIKSQGQSLKSEFYIVGIGASAGGLEALEQFFENMPGNNGMGFVVIQHLDPNSVDMMPNLLQRVTSMIVIQATDQLKVKPNCVYIIPPNKSMSLLNGTLHLFNPVEAHGLRLPIDIFFRSLALDKEEKSIAVILSGMGSDGSLGMKRIKEKNGLALIQEPATAKYDGMPRSALQSVVADIIAPASELPAKLITYLNHNRVAQTYNESEIKTKSNIDKIIILIREQTGQDFSLYKRNMLFRRIERRKSINQIDKIQNYVRFLQENSKELEVLSKEMLIGVTSFFRDSGIWEKLKAEVLPKLIKELPDGYILRAWVPACSTGEEAYSLAIIFKEVMGKFKGNKNISLQIFATDLDQIAIEKARKGVYSSNIDVDLLPERLKNYFIIDGEGYRVNNAIREMVVFATQNVTRDPPFTKLDILSCRNMLIYMESELQKRLMALFHYSLNPGGILILGIAETVGTSNTGFKELEPKLRIYKRAKTVLPVDGNLPNLISFNKTETFKNKPSPKVVENIQTLGDQFLLQHYMPASLLVNDKGDILYISGNTEKYLEVPVGKANWNFHAMAREGLRHELPGAFRRASQNKKPVIIRNIKIGNHRHTINLTVQQIEKPESLKDLFFVLFTDVPLTGREEESKIGQRGLKTVQKELEMELKRCYDEMQSTREEMQTSQEELRSTNEELQSTNEELQSTNEELTTSKEEMQSLNEELHTVNMELQSKVTDLLRINDDMKNLLNSTELATLFLDKNLNIRRFTDQVINIIKLREVDIGRPFTDLVSNLHYPAMEADARQVLKTLITAETEINTNDGRWFNIRIMPYRTVDDRIDGLVITFSDITKAKRLEIKLIEANEALLKNSRT